jgi:hypothetical protein
MEIAEDAIAKALERFLSLASLFCLKSQKIKKGGLIMLNKYIAVFFFLGIILAGNLSLARPVWAETLVQSTMETRLLVALRVGQEELKSDP